MLLSKVQ